LVDSLKALDPERPIREEQTSPSAALMSQNDPRQTLIWLL
jgi:hypothetical protein